MLCGSTGFRGEEKIADFALCVYLARSLQYDTPKQSLRFQTQFRGENMRIDYADLVHLNVELKRRDTRYHVSCKDENTVCIEPPGECCLTDDLKRKALDCIRGYYHKKNISVHFSDDQLYFTCER